jgi:MoaA/NifB/PqqE/SkfB family radical SAM enzyme
MAQRKVVVNKIWEELDLTKLKFVHFNGGEPLLSKEHVEFLNAVPNKRIVHLNYNTNGTILPTTELLELWEQFKLVQLDFSIDDVGSRYEYQRYPAKWETIENNLQWFIDNSPGNCMFATNTTVSVLNQGNLDNLNRWLTANFSSNRFTDPVEYRTQLATGKLSTLNVAQRSEQIVGYLDSLDARRGTSWKSTFPELTELLILNK